MTKYILIIIALITCISCKKEQQSTIENNYYKPQIGDSFEWRLDSIGLNEVNQYTCKIIDIDAFSATKELVDAFHARGIKVIAYISVGTLETYRPDSNLLPPEVVGNIYPAWPDNPNDKQVKAIETAAQKVLDARLQFPNSSLADLYDPLTMPPALVKAHNELDKAVDLAYRSQAFTSEANRMVFLFELYEKYTADLFTKEKVKKGKKAKSQCFFRLNFPIILEMNRTPYFDYIKEKLNLLALRINARGKLNLR